MVKSPVMGKPSIEFCPRSVVQYLHHLLVAHRSAELNLERNLAY
jgi:hypothetical protein